MRRILAPVLATAAIASAGVAVGGVGIASSATAARQPTAHELALAVRLTAVTRQLRAAQTTIGIQRRAIAARNAHVASLQGEITRLQGAASAIPVPVPVDLQASIAGLTPGGAFALLPLLVQRIQLGAPAYTATSAPGTTITFTFSFNAQQGDGPVPPAP